MQISAILRSDKATRKAQPHVSQSRIRDFFVRPSAGLRVQQGENASLGDASEDSATVATTSASISIHAIPQSTISEEATQTQELDEADDDGDDVQCISPSIMPAAPSSQKSTSSGSTTATVKPSAARSSSSFNTAKRKSSTTNGRGRGAGDGKSTKPAKRIPGQMGLEAFFR